LHPPSISISAGDSIQQFIVQRLDTGLGKHFADFFLRLTSGVRFLLFDF